MDNFLAVVNYDAEIPPEVAGECPMNTIVIKADGIGLHENRPKAAVGGEG